MSWWKHPGSWRKCKRWWYRIRVSLSSETCKAQRKGTSGLAKKGFQQWESNGKGGRRILNSWRKSIRKTWLAAGQRMLGSDWGGSPEWLHLGVGSTDHPSLLSIKHTRDWKQKLHSYCLGKKSPGFGVRVLYRYTASPALLEAHTQGTAISTPQPMVSEIWLSDFFHLV